MNNEKSSFYSFCLIAMLLCIFTNATSQPFITGDTLSSNTSYVNLKDTILPLVVKGHFEFDIDIDADNINDIGFYRMHDSSPSFGLQSYSVLSLNTIQFVCLPNSSNADTLSKGALIDNNLNWNDNYDGACLFYSFSSIAPPPWGPGSSSHGICRNTDNYIGFRKIYPADSLYGWFFFDLTSTFKIRAYAINKNLSPVSKKDSTVNNSFIIYPNPAKDNINIRFSENGTAKIFDIQGRVVKVVSFIAPISKIYISDLAEGVYTVKLFSGDMVSTGKIVKQ
jgi:hypothetical protein